MSSTDNRIVKMEFDNARFKRGAAETKQSLDQIDKSIATAGNGKGLLNLNRAMQTVGVTASKMAIVTTTALATIVNKVTNAGLAMASSLTLDPLKQGFSEYESLLTKQNVIMNATGKSATQVKKSLNDLNVYSDKTIYSFGNMTDAIQKFVNAGVDLDTSVVSIKGIANAAAFAGASSEEANRAMYAFSQSMSLGFIQLQDWNQIENANMGTIQFKNELLKAAVAAGTLTKRGKEYVTQSGKTVSATKGWRDGLQEQWATTEVLNRALGKYADESTNLGKKAFRSAQDVRTFSAFMDTLKESLGSGWAQIFTALIGGLEDSTKTWTNLSNTVGKVAHDFFNFATTAITTWKSLGGGQKVMEGLRNVASPFVALFKAIGDAWQEAFPTTGKGAGGVLYSISAGFAKLTKPLAVVAGWIEHLTPILTIMFQVFKMGANGLEAVGNIISNLTTDLMELAGVNMGDSGGGISGFVAKILEGVAALGQMGLDAAEKFLEGFIGGFTQANVDTAANVVGAGLLGAIFMTIRKFLSGDIFSGLGGGLLDKISESFDGLTGSLVAMQQNLKAEALMSIAIAIGVMTASLVALSHINGKDLQKSLTALAVAMGQLLIGMAILTKISGLASFLTLPVLAAGLVLLSSSLLILSGAIKVMSTLSWTELAKGLTGMAGALVVIAAAMKLMPKSLPITGAGLVLVSVGLVAIAGAMAAMSALSWEDIGRGLVSTAGALLIIAAAMKAMPLSTPIIAAGLVLVAGAIAVIAGALKLMGGMSWEEIAKGLTATGGALAILAIGLSSMSASLFGSAALVVAAGALALLVPSLMMLSTMSWGDIVKSLVGLGGALVILSLGLTAMILALPGAIALLTVTPALLGLAAAMLMLGSLSWGEITLALIALAAALAIIGIAGLLIAPVIPALLGLGASLLLLGAGLALAGVGVLAFSTGLAALVGLGAVAITYLSKYIKAFIDLLPELGEGFAKFIVSFAKAVSDNAPALIDAFVKMLTELISAGRKLIPKLGPLINDGVTLMIKVVKTNVPKLVNAGVDLIMALMRGLESRIGPLVSTAVSLMAAFIRAVGSQAGKLADAGADAIIEFTNSLAATIRDRSDEMGTAAGNLGTAIVEGLVVGIGKMAQKALDRIARLAGDMIKVAKDKLSVFSPSRVFRDIGKFIVQGLTNGIQNHAASAITAVASMVGGQISVANEYINRFIQDLDQNSIAARGKAEGLAAAAKRAQQMANKTKNKSDDKSANRLDKRAAAAEKAAAKAESRAEAAKAAQDRKDAFNKSSTLGKAQMKSEDAQSAVDAAKRYEQRAVKALAQADALDLQARKKGVKASQRKAMEKEADQLRRQARKDAKTSNAQLEKARTAAGAALTYQKKAGDEAAAAFQKMFDAEAKADADAKAYSKLTDAEKAEVRKKQAAELEKQAALDLAAAKKLAYTDIEAANELAAKAREEADLAREYLDDAASLSAQPTTPGASTGAPGVTVNLDASDAAAIAMSKYSDLYDSAYAAAASDRSVEFNQYNTSPKALDPIEIYRQSNNLFTYAAEKLEPAA